MAECELDLSHPYFLFSIGRLKDDPDFQQALDEIKGKVEKEHTCCHRVVQQFYGDKKFAHLYEKIWKYDWGESSASHRKAWRLVVVVPEPHGKPLKLIAGAMYTKAVAAQLSFKELAAIFAGITTTISAQPTPGADPPPCHFRHVPNGDGQTRSICEQCFAPAAISTEVEILERGEREHVCVSPKDSN